MEIVISIGLLVIGALLAYGFRRLEKSMESKESSHNAFNSRLMENSLVSLEVGKATAEAVRDGHCNGNVSHALERVEAARKETEEFLIKQTAENQRAS